MTVLPTILNRHIRPKRSNGIAMDQFCYLDRGVKRWGGISTGGVASRDGKYPAVSYLPTNVSHWRLTRKHLLGASISPFDPGCVKTRHSTIGYLSPMEFERQAGLA